MQISRSIVNGPESND